MIVANLVINRMLSFCGLSESIDGKLRGPISVIGGSRVLLGFSVRRCGALFVDLVNLHLAQLFRKSISVSVSVCLPVLIIQSTFGNLKLND